jgi:ATP-dependent protease ClpP protease subunit
MKQVLSMLVVLCVSMSCSAPAEVTFNKERTVLISGAIGPEIVDKANELMGYTSNTTQPIDIVISSPGGSIAVGNLFIDAMEMAKSRGIVIRCFTGTMAASMAFSIFAHCSERYATPNALLLYHPARVMEAPPEGLTAPQAEELYKQLKALDDGLLEFIAESTGMDIELLKATFYKEKLWTATELDEAVDGDWLTVVRDIKGVDSLIYRVHE